jgi:asparagine synthase (glutamine-hydrolysing)
MCGIVAVLSERADAAAPGIVAAMRDRLSHRGPDARSMWIGRHGRATIAFGFRRLAIIDPRPIADQPFFTPDGRVGIVFNGEIFNYVELRAELERRGVRFRTAGDTEVLLAAYLEWDEGCLERFNGQFAFVIWDGRQGRAFAARDRFGEKPFHYAVLPGGGLAIASEMKALLAHPHVSDEPDLEQLQAFATGRPSYHDAPTPFRAIKRLEPAQALDLAPDGTIRRQWRYWTPRYDESPRPFDATRDVEEFASLLRDAVRIRMRSDVTVGASLSGGVDSSSLVAVMADEGMIASGQLRHAISARFDDDPTMSEGPFVDRVVERTGIHALPVAPDPTRLPDELSPLQYHLELPLLSASPYLEWCVRRCARESGLVVMIDGQGADELLGGYHHYFPQYQRARLEGGDWGALVRNSRAFRQRLVRAASGFEDARRRINPRVAQSIPELLARRIVDALRGVSEPPARPGLPDARGGNRFRYTLASGVLYSSLPDQLVTADSNSMAFSVETRFPFLDYRLVDRIVTLPDAALVHDGWTKWILRAAVGNLLPPEVAWRADKLGFAAPLDRWLRHDLKGWAHHELTHGPITQLPFYDRAQIERDWARHQSGDGDQSWTLWPWIGVNRWLQLADAGVWRRGAAPQMPDRAPEHEPAVVAQPH